MSLDVILLRCVSKAVRTPGGGAWDWLVAVVVVLVVEGDVVVPVGELPPKKTNPMPTRATATTATTATIEVFNARSFRRNSFFLLVVFLFALRHRHPSSANDAGELIILSLPCY